MKRLLLLPLLMGTLFITPLQADRGILREKALPAIKWAGLSVGAVAGIVWMFTHNEMGKIEKQLKLFDVEARSGKESLFRSYYQNKLIDEIKEMRLYRTIARAVTLGFGSLSALAFVVAKLGDRYEWWKGAADSIGGNGGSGGGGNSGGQIELPVTPLSGSAMLEKITDLASNSGLNGISQYPYVISRDHVKNVPGDGNCLFHSLAGQLCKDDIRKIKKEASDFQLKDYNEDNNIHELLRRVIVEKVRRDVLAQLDAAIEIKEKVARENRLTTEEERTEINDKFFSLADVIGTHFVNDDQSQLNQLLTTDIDVLNEINKKSREYQELLNRLDYHQRFNAPDEVYVALIGDDKGSLDSNIKDLKELLKNEPNYNEAFKQLNKAAQSFWKAQMLAVNEWYNSSCGFKEVFEFLDRLVSASSQNERNKLILDFKKPLNDQEKGCLRVLAEELLNEYVSRMNNPGTFGTRLEVRVLSRLLNRSVLIWKPRGNGYISFYSYIKNGSSSPADWIHIFHSGMHYEQVVNPFDIPSDSLPDRSSLFGNDDIPDDDYLIQWEDGTIQTRV